MEIVGRITANANIKTVQERQLVEFTLAVNDRYRNGNGDTVDNANFFSCAYWIGTAIAPYLTKSTVVQLSGELRVKPWIGAQGDARASLNFHVNKIKFISKGERAAADTASDPKNAKPNPKRRRNPKKSEYDDLPF